MENICKWYIFIHVSILHGGAAAVVNGLVVVDAAKNEESLLLKTRSTILFAYIPFIAIVVTIACRTRYNRHHYPPLPFPRIKPQITHAHPL